MPARHSTLPPAEMENRLLGGSLLAAVLLHLLLAVVFSLSPAFRASVAAAASLPEPPPPVILIEAPPAEPPPLANLTRPVDQPGERPDGPAFEGAWDASGSSSKTPDSNAVPGPAAEGIELDLADIANRELGFGGREGDQGGTVTPATATTGGSTAPQSAPDGPELNLIETAPAIPEPAATAANIQPDDTLPTPEPETQPAETQPIPHSLTQPEAGAGPESLQRRAVLMEGSFDNQGQARFATEGTVLGRYQAQVGEAVGSSWQRAVLGRSLRSGKGRLRLQFRVRPNGEVTNLDFDRSLRRVDGTAEDITLDSVLEADIPPMPPAVVEELAGRSLLFTYDFHFR